MLESFLSPLCVCLFLKKTLSSNNIVVHSSRFFFLLFHVLQENGYRLLFLSARAISQAYRTRQFLFNLKQVMLKEIEAWFSIWGWNIQIKKVPVLCLFSCFNIYKMGRLYRMGLLLFPLMDFFVLYIEKVTSGICNLFEDINKGYFHLQSMLYHSQASYLSLGMPYTNPDNKIFSLNCLKELRWCDIIFLNCLAR